MVTVNPGIMLAGTVKELKIKTLVINYACQKNNAPSLLTYITKLAVVTRARVVSWILQMTSKKLTSPITRISVHKVYFTFLMYIDYHRILTAALRRLYFGKKFSIWDIVGKRFRTLNFGVKFSMSDDSEQKFWILTS